MSNMVSIEVFDTFSLGEGLLSPVSCRRLKWLISGDLCSDGVTHCNTNQSSVGFYSI